MSVDSNSIVFIHTEIEANKLRRKLRKVIISPSSNEIRTYVKILFDCWVDKNEGNDPINQL